jgi:hypothetical protein
MSKKTAENNEEKKALQQLQASIDQLSKEIKASPLSSSSPEKGDMLKKQQEFQKEFRKFRLQNAETTKEMNRIYPLLSRATDEHKQMLNRYVN